MGLLEVNITTSLTNSGSRTLSMADLWNVVGNLSYFSNMDWTEGILSLLMVLHAAKFIVVGLVASEVRAIIPFVPLKATLHMRHGPVRVDYLILIIRKE